MIEGVVCRRMDVEEVLRRSGRLKPLQFTFPPPNRLMRILRSVVGSQTTIMLGSQAYCSEGRGIGSKFVRHDPAWCEALLLEQLPHQPSRCFGIAPSLDEEVQNLAFVVDGAPEPVALPPDDDHHFIEVPMVAGPGAGAA